MGHLAFVIPGLVGLFLFLRSLGLDNAALVALVGAAAFCTLMSGVLLRD